ncbi:MAG: hypothetical protein ABR608_08555 [Pseudonocardiaceae bacterium]
MRSAASDRWAQWLLHRRDGGNPALRQQMLQQLISIRDRVQLRLGPDGQWYRLVRSGPGWDLAAAPTPTPPPSPQPLNHRPRVSASRARCVRHYGVSRTAAHHMGLERRGLPS